VPFRVLTVVISPRIDETASSIQIYETRELKEEREGRIIRTTHFYVEEAMMDEKPPPTRRL
jgi:hypothetical protein